MKIGFIGLGKMGSNMTRRLIDGGHEVVAYDPSEEARKAAVQHGVDVVGSREDVLNTLEQKIVWLMIPAQFVDDELEALLQILKEDAVIIDGGNSDFRLTKQRAKKCADRNVRLVDVGTSGGILGVKTGYSMMVGGEESAVEELTPIFDTLAPPDGWGYFGESGSGHYVKMVHNAIEYGVMESYAEGYRMLHDGPFDNIDLSKAGSVWQHGSIIASLLNGISAEALRDNPELNGIDGYVHESGEAKWTLEVAEDMDIKLPAIRAALNVRYASQKGVTNFSTKLLAAMRTKFGGHATNKDS